MTKDGSWTPSGLRRPWRCRGTRGHWHTAQGARDTARTPHCIARSPDAAIASWPPSRWSIQTDRAERDCSATPPSPQARTTAPDVWGRRRGRTPGAVQYASTPKSRGPLLRGVAPARGICDACGQAMSMPALFCPGCGQLGPVSHRASTPPGRLPRLYPRPRCRSAGLCRGTPGSPAGVGAAGVRLWRWLRRATCPTSPWSANAQVTVLFAEISDALALIRTSTPAWPAPRSALHAMLEAVHRYEAPWHRCAVAG